MENGPGQSVYTQLRALARHNPAFVQSLNTIVTQNILAGDSDSQAALSLILGDQNGNGMEKMFKPAPAPGKDGTDKPGYTKPDPNGKNPQLMNMLYSAFQARVSKQSGSNSLTSEHSSPPPPPSHLIHHNPPPQPNNSAVASPPPPSQPAEPAQQLSSQGPLMSMPPPHPPPAYLDPYQWQMPPPGILPTQTELHLSQLQYMYPQYLPIHPLWSQAYISPLHPPPPPALHPSTQPVLESSKRKLSDQHFPDYQTKRLCTGN